MNPDILIVGAGAAGLMAAIELGKAGKKVLILEARDRVGGRIMPLDEADFGFPAQGGAEWVHGEAPVTRALIKEAGLSIIDEDGEIWSTRNGSLERHKTFASNNPELKAVLEKLTEDISIGDFLNTHFPGDKYKNLRNSIIKAAEGYDAADVNLISTLVLKDEWLTNSTWDDGRIKEGYTGLLNFLIEECKKYGVEIRLNTQVTEVVKKGSLVYVQTLKDGIFEALKAIITVPLPVLKSIVLNPELNSKYEAISEIGYGYVTKVLIKFKTRWWETAVQGKDLSKMAFLLCNEPFLTWWTQYPIINTTLIGWMSGPHALEHTNASSEELLDIALTSLANVCQIDKEDIRKEIVLSRVINWQADPFAQGAYSYTKYTTGNAYERFSEQYENAIYFAGEAAYSGDATATVEGALGSGLETAQKILEK